MSPVSVAWAWRLQEKRRGRPGLGGQAWCYVVGLVFPHVAFPAWRNEWLPTGLWPWPWLKEYTYQGPEYTPQPASQPVTWPLNTPNHQSTCCKLAPSHCLISHNEKNDLILNGKQLNMFFLRSPQAVQLRPSFKMHVFVTQVRAQERMVLWSERSGTPENHPSLTSDLLSHRSEVRHSLFPLND